jgi:PAS domain S-box-containing protein
MSRSAAILPPWASLSALADASGADAPRRRTVARTAAEPEGAPPPVPPFVHRGPIAMLRVGPGGEVTYANEAAYQTIGLPRRLSAWRQMRERMPPAALEALRTAFARARDSAQRLDALHLRHANSTDRIVEVHLFPASEPGAVDVVLIDLTHQSETEAALFQSESLYNTFLEQSPVGLIHLDMTGTVTFENHRFRQIVGQAASDAWVGLSAFSVPGLDGLFGGAVRRLLAGEAVRELEVRYAPQRRPPRQLMLNGSPICQEDGTIVGAVVLFQDVTDERVRQGERQLRERFARAEDALRQAVFDGTDEGTFWRDAARIFAQTLGGQRAAILVPPGGQDAPFRAGAVWGEEASALQDLTLDPDAYPSLMRLAGQRAPAVLPGLADDPSFRLSDARESLLLPFFDESLEGFVLVERLHGGDPLLTSANESLVVGLVRLFETLLAWLRSTNRYRLTVSSIQDALFNFVYQDEGRHYLFVTPQIERITGYEPQAFLPPGGVWPDLLADTRETAALEAHEARIRAGQESSVSFRIRQARGGYRWVRETAVPHRDATGALSVVGTLADVTEQKRAETVLLQAKHDAEEQSRDKTAFIATLSHEVRTPLGTINGFAELLEAELDDWCAQTGADLPPQVDEFIDTIRGKTQHILTLVNDIFDLANLETGRAELMRAPLRVNDAVTDAVGVVAEELTGRGIALYLDLDPADPEVLVDAGRLRQALDQVLSNAAKFTQAGFVRVATRLEANRVRIEIEDTGIGMDPDYVDKLFTPFLQEDRRLNRDYEGTGVGLALAHRIVTALGGEITAESAKGHGSTFRLFLPAL